ncbi:MAG: phospholipid-binding domain-containing protein [Alphaproteobacteria bacterium]|nr:phospholipid-binding domain-containing protein [Alphaproteobacteria bacterium]
MRTLLLFALPLLLSGCVTAVTTGVVESGKAIADERSFGAQVDDATIYSAINRYFLETDANDLVANVTVNVRRGRVMLTGNVDKDTTPRLATEQAWRAQGVQEVINEIKVTPGAKFWNNANDALIKKNLESRLLVTKDVWVVNYSIDIVGGTAYLLGHCENQGELDRVLSVARTTRGVKQVVSYLKLRTDSTAAPASAYGAPPANYTPSYSAQPISTTSGAPLDSGSGTITTQPVTSAPLTAPTNR